MGVNYEIRKNTYYDSVTLMLISKDISKIEGVNDAIVGMGTDLNKELAEGIKMSNDEIKAIAANDFFISADLSDDSVWESVVGKLNELLNKKVSENSMDYKPKSINSALTYQSDSNIAIISVPGQYAAAEARKALDEGLHVMLFSDNVSIKDEKDLKELAYEKGLLMMGPDCGTAIINNVPLAFANVVNKGDIGIVAASGTGTQEVSVIIDKLGKGVSQVIGTGGRDLKEEIGGITMMQGLDALIKDDATSVIVLISKPPALDISKKILEIASKSPKPVVVDFIGGDYDMIKSYGVYPSVTLEDAARKAVALSKGEKPVDFIGFSKSESEIESMVQNEVDRFDSKQKYIRGLYTGGTLTDEAMKMLGSDFGCIYSNIPLDPKCKLGDSSKSIKHTCIDLGDDEFTQGRPHPMIDPSTRAERLILEAEDETVAIVLMDFVLGYGSNEDPVGEMIESIQFAKGNAEKRGGYLCVIGSICGTDKDPQNLIESQMKLEENDVIVMPSNAQAVRFVKKTIEKIG
jgi:succinyl-CoA synthetase alpha subunit